MATTVRLDRRTALGRDVTAFRKALIEHVGAEPSATRRALVEIACQLRARVVSMDLQFAERGEQSVHDSKAYLAWSNSLGRTMRQLGLAAREAAPPSLASLWNRDDEDAA